MTTHQPGKDQSSIRDMAKALSDAVATLPPKFEMVKGDSFKELLKEENDNYFLEDTRDLMIAMSEHQKLRDTLSDELSGLVKTAQDYLNHDELPVIDEKTRELLIAMMTAIRSMTQQINNIGPDVNLLRSSLRRSIEKMRDFLSSGEE